MLSLQGRCVAGFRIAFGIHPHLGLLSRHLTSVNNGGADLRALGSSTSLFMVEAQPTAVIGEALPPECEVLPSSLDYNRSLLASVVKVWWFQSIAGSTGLTGYS